MTTFFADKVVLITGASAGVGLACARRFAQANAKLVLVARGEEKLKAAADELSSQTDVWTVPMDVTTVADCEALIANTVEHFGRLDVLVNNAGMHSRGSFDTKSTDAIAAMADVNFRAPLVLSAAALPELKKNRGAIVMVGSLAGRTPMQGAATYGATKAGLRSFSLALRDELADTGVRVGLVSPGPVDTGFIMEEIDQVEDIVFSQPMSTAEEVADNVLKLASQDIAEIAMPSFSGFLTTISYLFPGLRRGLRPKLYEKGRKNKDKYRQRNARMS
ncbi:MAG: SDR family oxidoreductase [Pseudomonadota bacterium]